MREFMAESKIRTRFAPSPTGFMHIGNLRTALFEFLVAKHQDGDFVLRIEDTDQGRYVEGALEKIYQALELTGLKHDEGPDIGGPYTPYVQSERKDIYLKEVQKLLDNGTAYYCFCSEERLEKLHEKQRAAGSDFIGYDGHCRNLSKEEVEEKLANGEEHVIRQKMPRTGSITYTDEVYGELSFENKTFEDQVLIKSDGLPTYNFANVVDDHAMNITHIVRGNEYLSSTPKYIYLYEAFGYPVPKFIHLPLILNKDGNKLSKRDGATTFEELIDAGYLPEAIVNYLALLGWSPKGTQELFTLDELIEAFKIDGISKSPAVYDEDKLKWFNEQYLKAMSTEEFIEVAKPYFYQVDPDMQEDTMALLADNLKTRIGQLTEIPEKIHFVAELIDYDLDLFVHKKSKSTLESSYKVLADFLEIFPELEAWDHDALYHSMKDYATEKDLKTGTVMFPIRIALTGQKVTPGGTVQMLQILGRDESMKRLKTSFDRLAAELK